MTTLRLVTFGYFIALLIAASLNYLPIPGIIDDQGYAFGIFALDVFDDLLHIASALWALAAALISHRASRTFLTYFGALYFVDGLLGLATGSGFLDAGILIYGFYEYSSFLIKLAANIPHLFLGGFALACAYFGRK
ncbi:DUF4383 domain-containing protein [Litoreibacter albidus]|uniref:DUF4383 domain-containing protein n=1 Tax=Litoreibacter albidus TaxID=670155 RepID=A0A1H2VWP4_9RHOB|nr:DUF4383 domain-containing protein [Litoreibacter albidus]SDW72374.1 hypothetical protein SAMN04488001_1641 [Litoreibacter albidus]